jgi:hypothetical protein
MKKLIALACGVSALALASGAQAAETYSVTINGTVPAFCKLAGASGTSGTNITGGWNTGSTTQATATVTSLADSSGVVQHTSAAATLAISANASCKAVLNSLHGGLYNTTHPTAAVISYDVTAYDTSKTATAAAPVAAGNFKQIDLDYNDLLSDSIYVAFDIPEGGANHPVAAGSYTDTLTLTLTPGV